MLSSDVSKMCRTLLALKLITEAQLEECLGELNYTAQNLGQLLDVLRRKNYLTPYQTKHLAQEDLASLILGDFALLYQNASGSFARVYRARSLADGQMVGIKVLRQRYAEDPKAVAQFRREAQLGKGLRHPNIVPIYEVLQDRDCHFLTMEFVEGGNFRDFINIRKQLVPAEATKYILEMALGLHYALGKGLTHRDLKMTNVLMSIHRVAKLVDFGLAATDGSAATGVARGESAARAIEYATLEKGTGVVRNDPRTDLYFLGAIYYELLTGIPPLPRTRDRQERAQFTRYSGVRPILQVCPSLPREVVRIAERLMQVNPNQRYQAPGDVIVDLRPTLLEIGGTLPSAEESEPTPVLRTPGMNSPTPSAPPGVAVPLVRPSPSAPAPAPLTTILCIESRHKQQEIIRTFFSKRGYRVLMLGDLQRGINLIRENAPDCVLLIGHAVGDGLIKGFHELNRAALNSKATCLLVLSEKQADLKESIAETHNTRVLVQPLTMRQLHEEVRATLAARNAASAPSKPNGKPYY